MEISKFFFWANSSLIKDQIIITIIMKKYYTVLGVDKKAT